MGNRKSVLITGCGIISAIGNGKGEVLESLLSNRTGIGPLKYIWYLDRSSVLRHGP